MVFHPTRAITTWRRKKRKRKDKTAPQTTILVHSRLEKRDASINMIQRIGEDRFYRTTGCKEKNDAIEALKTAYWTTERFMNASKCSTASILH
jgi:hypothetical protein